MSTLEHSAQTGSTLSGSPSPKLQANDPALIERVIQPSRGWIAIDWKELYQSRELFSTLIMRDIKIRYKQTVFGVLWAILQPLAQMIVFTMVFGHFKGVTPNGVPYPLFVFTGLIPWTFFSSAVGGAGNSLLGQQHLLTKIYFPRLYVPASTAGAFLVDMAIGLALAFALMPFYHQTPSTNLVFLPLVVLMTFGSAFGLGLIFASITVVFRDLRFVTPFLMSIMMFASPLFFQPTLLSRPVQLLVAINPVTGIINTFRWSILGLPLDVPALLISLSTTIVLLIFGLYFFRKTEKFFADIL